MGTCRNFNGLSLLTRADLMFGPSRHGLIGRTLTLLLIALQSGCGKGDKGTPPIEPGPNSWAPIASAPSGMGGLEHTVWTEREMVVWGELKDKGFGMAYAPSTNRWRLVSTKGAPSTRSLCPTIWTGTEMIVWGGFTRLGPPYMLRDGARYDPSTDSWRPVDTITAPLRRKFHCGVWTGSEMLIWGGITETTDWHEVPIFDGARYDPILNRWRPLSGEGAPKCEKPVAVWTGTEMIVLGDESRDRYRVMAGALYNPSTDSWRPMNFDGGIWPGGCRSFVWTGDKLLVYGVTGNLGPFRFDPMENLWSVGSAVGQPGAPCNKAALWTGRELFVWGGHYGAADYDRVGGLYNPATDTWRPTPLEGAPSRRGSVAAVWTGTDVIIWGGFSFAKGYSDGARYRP